MELSGNLLAYLAIPDLCDIKTTGDKAKTLHVATVVKAKQPSAGKLDITIPNLCDIKTTGYKAKSLCKGIVIKAKQPSGSTHYGNNITKSL